MATSCVSLSSDSGPNLNDGYAAPGPKFKVTNGAMTSWVMADSISAVTAWRDFRKKADWSWDKANEPRPREARDDRPVKPARTDEVCQVSRKVRAALNSPAPRPSLASTSNVFSPGGGLRKPTTPDE